MSLLIGAQTKDQRTDRELGDDQAQHLRQISIYDRTPPSAPRTADAELGEGDRDLRQPDRECDPPASRDLVAAPTSERQPDPEPEATGYDDGAGLTRGGPAPGR